MKNKNKKPVDLRRFYDVEARSNFGCERVLYQLKSSGLVYIKVLQDGGNLVGFSEPHNFAGLSLDEAKKLAVQLTSEYTCKKARCGCHLCYFSIDVSECDSNGHPVS